MIFDGFHCCHLKNQNHKQKSFSQRDNKKQTKTRITKYDGEKEPAKLLKSLSFSSQQIFFDLSQMSMATGVSLIHLQLLLIMITGIMLLITKNIMTLGIIIYAKQVVSPYLFRIMRFTDSTSKSSGLRGNITLLEKNTRK